MTLEQLLNWLQLPVSAIDGRCARFRVDESVAIQLELTVDGEYLRIRSAVGHTLDIGPSKVAFDIAVSNYAGATTGGGSLGLNPVNGEVLLFLEAPCALMNAATLETVLGRFVEAALYWHSRLENPTQSADTALSDVTPQAWVRA
jgi:Tir chaperone protein (CesT) family